MASQSSARNWTVQSRQFIKRSIGAYLGDFLPRACMCEAGLSTVADSEGSLDVKVTGLCAHAHPCAGNL